MVSSLSLFKHIEHPQAPGTSWQNCWDIPGSFRKLTFKRRSELFDPHPFAWKTPTPPGRLQTSWWCSLLLPEYRSLGNGVPKNGVRNRCPYRRCGVDTEIPYRLLSLILCSGESVEAEFSRWFWRHRGSRR